MIDIEAEKERIMNNLDSIEKPIRKTKGYLVNYSFKHEMIRDVIQLQRDVEYIYSQISHLKTPKTEKFIKRIAESVENLIKFINSNDSVSYYDSQWTSGLLGDIKSLKESGYINDSETDNCLYVLNNIRHIALMNFFADIQLINRMLSIPVEEKKEIIKKLYSANLENISDILNEAEGNVISNDVKDAADRCREALEKTIESFVVKKGGNIEKFVKNLEFLFKNNIIDEPTKVDTQGFYSHLAMIGVHGKGDPRLVDIVAKHILDETYRKIIKLIEISEKTIK